MEEGDETPSAELFHRLVGDGRNHSEWRTAFSVLQSYLQASGSVWFDRGSQSGVQRASHDLAQELN